MILDIEANGLWLDVTKIWVVKLKDGDIFHTFREPEPFKEFLNENVSHLIGHNIYGYDLLVLEKVWGVSYGHNSVLGKKIDIVDTLMLSQYAEPDMIGHSLDDWGKRLGEHKIDYRRALISCGALSEDAPRGAEFSFYHPLMESYCERDCEVCELIYERLKNVCE